MRIDSFAVWAGLAFPALALAMSLRPPEAPAVPPHNTIVADMAGGTAGVAVPARRVAVLPPFLSRYLATAGAEAHAVGTSRVAMAPLRDGLFDGLFPSLSSLPVVANGVGADNPEALLALAPDAVLVWSDEVPSLRRLGMQGVLGLKGDPNDQAGVLTRMVALFGRISEQDTRATWLLARWRAQRQALTAALPHGRPAPTIAVLYRGAGIGQIGGRYAHYNDAIGMIGAQNPAARQRVTGNGNMEELILLDPDMIVLAEDYDRSPAELFADPSWQALRAQRTHRIYKAPRLLDLNGPVDDPLFAAWLAELAYGDAMPPRWRAQFADAMRQVYGATPPSSMIDAVLQIDQNRPSAGYARFDGPQSAVRFH